jgi:phosphotransacetylase
VHHEFLEDVERRWLRRQAGIGLTDLDRRATTMVRKGRVEVDLITGQVGSGRVVLGCRVKFFGPRPTCDTVGSGSSFLVIFLS